MKRYFLFGMIVGAFAAVAGLVAYGEYCDYTYSDYDDTEPNGYVPTDADI